MDSVRYFIALIVLLGLPPGILLWFAIHPFAGFWRRLGPVWTYSILMVPMIILMLGFFLVRKKLLAIDFDTNYATMALGILCWAGAMIIAVKRKRYLTFGILAGLPELSQKRYPGKLLTEGIYAKIRHPRYVEALLGTLGYAFFANHLAPYVVSLLSIPVLYLIILIEERELLERFGNEYTEYCRKVPRIIPQF